MRLRRSRRSSTRALAHHCRSRQLRQRSRPDAAAFPITAPWQQVLRTRLFLTHGHLFSPDNLPPLAAGDVWFTVILIFRLPKNAVRFIFNPGSVSIPKADIRQLRHAGRNTLSVIALNDQQVIAQVAINP
jgi:predicted phosphodiesterase